MTGGRSDGQAVVDGPARAGGWCDFERTDAERALWHHLRGKRLQGLKFRRQHPYGRYILDFVCLEARLVIELDGGQHQDSPADHTRDAWLQAQGFQILRCWNLEVLTQPEAVLERLCAALSPA